MYGPPGDRLEVVVVIVAVVAVVGQRQPAAPHADDDREHDRDVGAGHAGEEERRDAPLGRDRVGLDDRDGARERHARRGGEREVLEPLAVLELAERQPLVLVLAALARLQRALERGLGAADQPRLAAAAPLDDAALHPERHQPGQLDGEDRPQHHGAESKA